MQQDSDEFLSSLFSALGKQLTSPTASIKSMENMNNMIEVLFGLEMVEK